MTDRTPAWHRHRADMVDYLETNTPFRPWVFVCFTNDELAAMVLDVKVSQQLPTTKGK